MERDRYIGQTSRNTQNVSQRPPLQQIPNGPGETVGYWNFHRHYPFSHTYPPLGFFGNVPLYVNPAYRPPEQQASNHRRQANRLRPDAESFYPRLATSVPSPGPMVNPLLAVPYGTFMANSLSTPNTPNTPNTSNISNTPNTPRTRKPWKSRKPLTSSSPLSPNHSPMYSNPFGSQSQVNPVQENSPHSNLPFSNVNSLVSIW